MFCRMIVLPARGGDVMSARWPFPIGAMRSMIRVEVVVDVLHLELILRIQRRQVVEDDLVLADLGVLGVDLLDLEEREVPLLALGGPDLAADGVAGAQPDAPD